MKTYQSIKPHDSRGCRKAHVNGSHTDLYYKGVNTYNNVLEHSKRLIRINKSAFNTSVLSPHDVAGEVFILSAEKGVDVVSATRTIILTEVRRQIANRQRKCRKNVCGEKKCKQCNEVKTYAEFYPMFDKRIGLKYFDSHCKKCRLTHLKTEKVKARRKELYAVSDRAKMLAHLRYLKFKSKKLHNGCR